MIEYIDVSNINFQNSIPKISLDIEVSIWKKIKTQRKLQVNYGGRLSKHLAYFHNAPRYWVRSTGFAPYFWNERDGEKLSTQMKILRFDSENAAASVVAMLNSSLFFWWFIVLSDCRHLNLREIDNYPLNIASIQRATQTKLASLVEILMADLQRNSRRKEAQYKTTGKVIYDEYYPRMSKDILDEIDQVLAQHYGFTDEELDFIINYDIKYRMGDDLFTNEE